MDDQFLRIAETAVERDDLKQRIRDRYKEVSRQTEAGIARFAAEQARREASDPRPDPPVKAFK